ncbi:unnamed protein product [Sphagnum compactum]
MKNSVRIVALQALLMAVVILLAIDSINAASINIRNQCSETISACATCNICGGQVNCYALAPYNGFQVIDVGPNWPGGVIWGYPGGSANPTDGNNAKPQADLAEITIGAGGEDYYDISNVNAYNLPLLINPTTIAPPGQRQGLQCGTPICSIGNIYSFCQSPNFLTGAVGYGCYNVDGPGPVPTPGTEQFANACPDAYSYSKDDANHVYACPTGSNYEVVFCP